jgi:hypothetical protein
MRVVARWVAAVSLVGAALAVAPGLGTASAVAAGTAITVTDGGAPGWVRFDDHGNGVDAHDGEIRQFGHKYYLYGTAYGCGYLRLHGYYHDTRPVTPFCGFVVYTSTDLRHWTYVGPLFDPATTTPTNWQQTCNSATLSCYRPHVLYDAASHYYRLWVNTYDRAPDGVTHGYHVLKSTSPVGPFVEDTGANGQPVLPRLAYPDGGDFDLFQDADGSAYIVYATRFDALGPDFAYNLVVERLSNDYTTGTGIFSTLDTAHTEAPSMFRRGSSYYITMSDPQCAYCAGTGTAYLRAPSPLGPWRGVGANVALSARQLYVDSRVALFTGADATTQSNLRGLRNYDVTFRARGLPDTTAATTHSTRVGWMFRAADGDHGYFWILSNRPYGKFPARLSKELVWNGKVLATTNVGIPTRLSSTALSLIRTRAVGTKIRTWLNGKVIDTTWMNTTKVNKWWDRHLYTGYVGIRETGGYSAYFDDFSLSRPPTLGYRMYLAQNFNTASMAEFPRLNTYRRHGIVLSATSCGGQPSDVAQLRAPTGAEYLYQSDRWDNGDPNEGQATQYWEPLKFNADGSIQGLTCGARHTTVLSDATPATSDVSSDGWIHGTDGFSLVQDITSTRSRGQSFAVSADGNLTQVALTLFRTDDANGDGPNADLMVSLYDVGGPNGTPAGGGTPIATATADATQILWSPRTVLVPLSAPLVAGHQYAVVLSTVSATGAYGTARADGTAYDADPTGAGLVSTGDPTAAWQIEPPNDLRYALTVQAAA